ncbi:MAG: phosphate acyltransferase [Elusimicrobia bacterium GWA2_61_42]|nr:MAG: phosphate acyltransferase [Elusimicrobia bacterium GWA2_61_42]OGR74218.1 MAG: phosphate acyltransferase [Elusimicrobia bacterium GWC2_61_25]
MRIALDAHGGDFGLKPNIEGALLAAKKLPHEIILVGRDPEIREELRRLGAEAPERITIVHAQQIIEMAAEPVAECRAKPESSLMVGAGLVHDGKADAFISAGSSGAIMVAALLKIKRIPGVIRPAIAAPLPTLKGTTLLLDAGANMDCKPWHLAQFAVMGSVYMRSLFKIENPSVGLLSIGEEETKGNALVQESLPLIKNMGVNLHGPVEGRDIPEGLTDVVVADGFTGNVALKLYEGSAKVVFKMLKEQIMRKFTYKIGAMLMRKVFTEMKIKMSVDIYGGAPLLGVNGVVLVCHGKVTPNAVFNAVRVSGELAASGMVTHIRQQMEQVKDKISAAKEQAE